MKIAECKVELIDSMGTDLSVVNAARVSFHKESFYEFDMDDPFVRYLSSKDKKLIKYLADHNHHTPFGHCFLSFRIKAPIFIARQLAKHQVGLCWNEVSRRYVDDEPEFFLPSSWRSRPESSIKQGSGTKEITHINWELGGGLFHPEIIRDAVLSWVGNAYHNYKMLLKAGVAPEQARMILPQNMMTEWIWSGSLLAFMRICNLRLDSHTQKETQDVAKEIAFYLEKEFPESWGVYKRFNENI